MLSMLVALHMGGIPELAMVLGPVIPIAVFVLIARRDLCNEALQGDAVDPPATQDPPATPSSTKA